MSQIKKNSILLLSFMYTNIFLSLSLVFISTNQLSNLRYLAYIILFLISLWVNKVKLSKKFLLFSIIILFFMLVNVILVSYPTLVLTEIFSITLISIVPLYIFSTNNILFEDILETWFKFSFIVSLIFPLYYYLYEQDILGYWHIADLTSINIVILFYYFFILNNKHIGILIMLLLNFVMGLFFGSRSSFVGALISCLIVFFILNRQNKIKHLIQVLLFSFGIIWIIYNLDIVLIIIQNILERFNLTSRNITLFIYQLQNDNLENILGGRSEIYKIVTKYIQNKGIFPGGLATTRFLTNGSYYHAHNVFLDLLSIFGFIGTFVVLSWYIFKILQLYRARKYNSYKFDFFVITSMLFWTAAFVDAYFLNNIFSIVSFSLLLFNVRTKN